MFRLAWVINLFLDISAADSCKEILLQSFGALKAIFALSNGIIQPARHPCGAFQSSGTFHRAVWLDRKVFLSTAFQKHLSLSFSVPNICKTF